MHFLWRGGQIRTYVTFRIRRANVQYGDFSRREAWLQAEEFENKISRKNETGKSRPRILLFRQEIVD